MYLSEINIYPVKSLKGIPLDSAVVEQRGFEHDRRWMLVDSHGTFMTQREFPAMAAIKTSVTDGVLTLANGSGQISAPVDREPGEMIDVSIWNDGGLSAVVADAEVNEWLSRHLDTDCRLVRMPLSTSRAIDANYRTTPDDVVSFADAYPFLLISEGSLADLNSRLKTPVPMTRFRPNLVVNGSEAFEEDSWKRIRIGSNEFHVVKPCARCVMTTVDQVSGEKDGKEPLATLSQYRNREGKVLFGQNLIAETLGGTVRVGDEIEVMESS
jgi:uncharacterized protein YcbX